MPPLRCMTSGPQGAVRAVALIGFRTWLAIYSTCSNSSMTNLLGPSC